MVYLWLGYWLAEFGCVFGGVVLLWVWCFCWFGWVAWWLLGSLLGVCAWISFGWVLFLAVLRRCIRFCYDFLLGLYNMDFCGFTLAVGLGGWQFGVCVGCERCLVG